MMAVEKYLWLCKSHLWKFNLVLVKSIYQTENKVILLTTKKQYLHWVTHSIAKQNKESEATCFFKFSILTLLAASKSDLEYDKWRENKLSCNAYTSIHDLNNK